MKKFAFYLLLFSSGFISHMTLCAQTRAIEQLVYELRNPETGPARFRAVLENIGEYVALDVLNELQTEEKVIRTLTGVEATHQLIAEVPALVTILRAGLPLNAGVNKIFPNAEVGFLGMSRDEETLKAKVDYIALPELKNRTVILVDTMLATGGSIIDALEIISRYEPKKIFIISAIAAQPGIERVMQYNPAVRVFAAAIDEHLNEKGYIVPGLGDAGDRSYGRKCINK